MEIQMMTLDQLFHLGLLQKPRNGMVLGQTQWAPAFFTSMLEMYIKHHILAQYICVFLGEEYHEHVVGNMYVLI